MRKKRIYVLFLSCSLFLLCGCYGGTDRQAQDTYKAAGIEVMEAGNYDDAIASFQSALDESLAVVGEQEIDICYYKAMSQYLAGYTDQALTTYTALISYDGKRATPYYLRGNLYLDQGDTKSAKADYDTAISLDSKNLELYISIYDNLKAAGFSEDGTLYLEQAVQTSGTKADDYARRGRAYTLLGDYESAESELQKAVDAGSSQALLYKGQLLEEEGNPSEAQTLYENYISLHKDDAQALNSLGCLEMSNANYAQALTYFSDALAAAEASGVSKQEILRNQILAYEYNGQFDAAKAAMESYAASYTLDTELEREYIFLQTRGQ